MLKKIVLTVNEVCITIDNSYVRVDMFCIGIAWSRLIECSFFTQNVQTGFWMVLRPYVRSFHMFKSLNAKNC